MHGRLFDVGDDAFGGGAGVNVPVEEADDLVEDERLGVGEDVEETGGWRGGEEVFDAEVDGAEDDGCVEGGFGEIEGA